MNTKRTPARRVGDNEVQEEIPPQVEEIEKVPQAAQCDQVPNVGGGYDPPKLNDRDIREALLAFSRAVTTQVNVSMGPRANVVETSMTSRFIDFVRMNHPMFLGSEMGDDPQEFIDEVYNIVHAIRVTSREKAELASYQLKDLAQVWYTQWTDNRPGSPVRLSGKNLRMFFLVNTFPVR